MIYSIYTLAHPETNIIFYVGKTISMKNRYKAHLNLKGADANLKSNIIGYMLENGKMPVIEEIDSIECVYREDEDLVNEMEVYWMHQLKSWGMPLSNVAGLYTKQRGVRRFSHLLKASTNDFVKDFLYQKSEVLFDIKNRVMSSHEITDEVREKLLVGVKVSWNKILDKINNEFETELDLLVLTENEQQIAQSKFI